MAGGELEADPGVAALALRDLVGGLGLVGRLGGVGLVGGLGGLGLVGRLGGVGLLLLGRAGCLVVPWAREHRSSDREGQQRDGDRMDGAIVKTAVQPGLTIPQPIGGGGLASTAGDYGRFVRMLLNGGELDGVRILSRKTIEYMASDHLGDIRTASAQRGAAYLPGPGSSFGLGFGVRIREGEATTPGSVGEFTWGGLYGTTFWVDPKENMAVVWMAQQVGRRTYYRSLVRDLVYGALVQ